MLAKRIPMIGKLSVSSRNGNGVSDTATSPRSPLEYKSDQSPRGTKSYEIGGGVGLGIAVALEKPIMSHEVLAKYALLSPRSRRSAPIPVHSVGIEGMEVDDLENYTYVTCHTANRSFTKVYYDGCDVNNTVFDTRSSCDLFKEVKRNPVSDFLSCCDLCKKNLHGKDIYMYRGEKAFCSTECRSMQIGMDELKEQRSRSADLSSSPPCYSSSSCRDEIFSTGILAI